MLQLVDSKSSSFGSGGARLLVELLVSWIGWRVISLDWVCVFGQVGKRVCFGSLALFGFLWTKTFVLSLQTVCVCVCVQIESLLRGIPSFGGWNFPLAENSLSKAQKRLLESLKQWFGCLFQLAEIYAWSSFENSICLVCFSKTDVCELFRTWKLRKVVNFFGRVFLEFFLGVCSSEKKIVCERGL